MPKGHILGWQILPFNRILKNTVFYSKKWNILYSKRISTHTYPYTVKQCERFSGTWMWLLSSTPSSSCSALFGTKESLDLQVVEHKWIWGRKNFHLSFKVVLAALRNQVDIKQINRRRKTKFNYVCMEAQ